MTDQVQYLVEFTIIDEKTEEFKSLIHSLIEKVKKNEPGIDSYQLFYNSGDNKSYMLERFPNSAGVMAHLAHVGPMLPDLLELAPITRFEIFGNISNELAESLSSLGPDIYSYLNGFNRAKTPA
jgi:quinol monooxygenase YgiN